VQELGKRETMKPTAPRWFSIFCRQSTPVILESNSFREFTVSKISWPFTSATLWSSHLATSVVSYTMCINSKCETQKNPDRDMPRYELTMHTIEHKRGRRLQPKNTTSEANAWDTQHKNLNRGHSYLIKFPFAVPVCNRCHFLSLWSKRVGLLEFIFLAFLFTKPV